MAFLIPSLLIYLSIFGSIESGYIITTPKTWTVGTGSQICASLTTGTFTAADSLTYKLEEIQNKTVLPIEDPDLMLPEGRSFGCIDVPVPPAQEGLITLSLTGSIENEPANEMVNLTFTVEGVQIFISTDKYLYRPGQKVQFRILTVEGPKISVVTDPYEEVYVNNPSGTRIAQWNNVDNSAGLVHLEFDLYDEVENGDYTIGVKPFNSSTTQFKNFELRDYVLPRFEVTIESPKAILGSDETVTISVCATYTFGEPVRGNATLYLAPGIFPIRANISQNTQINGCNDFTYSAKDLLFDYNNCHISVVYLTADVVVVEDGTGVEIYGTNYYIPVYRRGIMFRDQSVFDVKKPYLPALIEIVTEYADKKPAINEPMNVCTFYEGENVCKNFTTNSEGILHFIIPSQLPSPFVEIKALNFPKLERNFNDVMEESSHFIYISDYREYVDPTNSSLTIMRKMIQCTTGENVNFNIPIVYITREDLTVELNVQIAARGQVLAFNKMNVQLSESDLGIKDEDKLIPLETVPDGVILGSLDIPMTLSEQSSPRITIMAWYVKEDGSVVADSSEVEVSECLSHKVKFEWSSPRVQPGEEANLIVKGASNALCSIGVVDKSVDILSERNNNYLNIVSIFDVLYFSNIFFGGENQQTLEYCLRKYGSSFNTDIDNEFEFSNLDPYSIVEALHMFNDAGYLVISNLDIAKSFCEQLIILDMQQQFKDEVHDALGGVGLRFKGGAPDASFGAPPEQAEGGSAAEVAEDTSAVVPDSGQERSYFPETLLWRLTPLSSSGESTQAIKLPDTITEWIGNAVCVHPTVGVGISNYSSIITFTPFFIDLTLPSSATRGEILPIAISIFNYLEDDLPVRVVLEQSSDLQFIDGETGVRELCIKSSLKAVETIKVNLTRIGDINITVEASSQPLSKGYCGSGSPPLRKDRLIRSLSVEAEGYVRDRTFTEYICTEDIEDSSSPAASWTLEAPESAVADSARSWITAIGDLMGPTIENLGYLIGLPYGCGEQNLLNFAPNVYILQYLDASGQATPFIREKIIGFLNEGYQRQLRYKHTDGSYSTFGDRDVEGSTWLTAYVIKSFAQARNYTFIDEQSLEQSTNWLKGLQGSDGCFEPKGRVINKYLLGGIAGSGGSKGLLTAYVLAAIIEAGSIDDQMEASALQCVNTETSTHPYSLALRSYSLALAEAPNAKEVIDQLLSLSVSNSTMLRWDLPDREGQSTSLHVETAAYALLSLVTYDYDSYKEDIRKIVRWISAQQNTYGGYESSQNTVVSLQALAAFEKAQPKGPMDMDITVSSSNLDHSFKITDENRFLQQRVDVPTLPADIDVRVDGTGCALVQGVLRYNVLADSDSGVFTLKVDVENAAGESCPGKTRNITVCTSYTLQDEYSNMAIIAFKLVTGYVANLDDLQTIVGNGTEVFKRFEIDGQQVTLYLDEITSEEICISLRAFQEIEIGSAKPGSVSVYDYYQPEYIATKALDLSSSCALPG